jgi:hypothetical protein
MALFMVPSFVLPTNLKSTIIFLHKYRLTLTSLFVDENDNSCCQLS